MKPKPLASLNHFTVPCSIVLPVSILNFCSEESLRLIRGDAGWRDRLFKLLGESNLADVYLMRQLGKTIHSEPGRRQLSPNRRHQKVSRIFHRCISGSVLACPRPEKRELRTTIFLIRRRVIMSLRKLCPFILVATLAGL